MTVGPQSDSKTVSKEALDGQLFSVHGLSRRRPLLFFPAWQWAWWAAAIGIRPKTSPPPPPPAGLSQVNGTVLLPSGSGLSINSLALKVMGQTISLGSAATFTAGVSPGAPTMALVTDANGNGIMAGFLDPTLSGSQPITPRSTGVVWRGFALGGPFLPAER